MALASARSTGQSGSGGQRESAKDRSGGTMTRGNMVWIGLGALAAVALLANAKDLVRYIKIANM